MATRRLRSGAAPPQSPVKTKAAPRNPRPAAAANEVHSAEPDAQRESVTAYLRIRPTPKDADTSTPYLTPLSDTVVQLADLSETSKSRLGSGPAKFTFSRIFGPDTSQQDFFRQTTLPLIADVLNGRNALLFAYGVSNSGKTYSIQGAHGEDTAGILPRTLDAIYNSVDNFPGHLLPQATSSKSRSRSPAHVPSQAEAANGISCVSVNPELQYSIHVSYAEIYNERIFDLLEESATAAAMSNTLNGRGTLHVKFPSTNTISTLNATTSSEAPAKTISLHRKALALKTNQDGSKFIAGLKEVEIHSADEAKELLQLGQMNRRVFGTLANRASSRSHAIFTVKVITYSLDKSRTAKEHQTTKLCIVDLAGSERSKNTQSTGERLREAGNINKSLMVLGQCLEALRSNQRRPVTHPDGPTKTAFVPFRHSKLTELFQDFFSGQGKVSMIVNINPYDTGLDENLRVMEFASLAREVTIRAAAHQRRRTFKLSLPGIHEIRETLVEIVEDEAEEDEHGAPINPLVDALFDEVESLRKRLHQSEIRAAMIEAEVREEMFREMERRMQEMEQIYAARLLSEAEYNESKTNRKLDLLYNEQAHCRSSGASLTSTGVDSQNSSRNEVFTRQRTSSGLDDESPVSRPPVRVSIQEGDLGLFLRDEESASETDGSYDSSCSIDAREENSDESHFQGRDSDESYQASGSSSSPSQPVSVEDAPSYPGRGKVMPGTYSANSSLSDEFDNLSLQPIDTPGTRWKKWGVS